MLVATPRVRVGAVAACAWSADPTSRSPCEDARPVGVFAGHVVIYEQAQTRLLVRQFDRIPDAQTADEEEDSRAIKLPEDVAFASHQEDYAPFVLMWSRMASLEEDDDDENKRLMTTVYVADVKNRSLVRIPAENLASGDISIQDGVIDSRGQHVVLIDAARGRLLCWSALQKLTPKALSSQTAEWTQRQLTSDDERESAPEASTSCAAAGRFARSALLGRCFSLVRASWDPSDAAAVRIDKWVFDIEMDWKQTEYSSNRLSVESLSSNPEPLETTMQLRMNCNWTHGAVAVGSALIEFSADFASLSAAKVVHSSVALEQQIIDVAWIDKSTTLAMLLAQGGFCY
ncbi:hypothetical protein Gpo141_00001437 [Globisporangium polare]